MKQEIKNTIKNIRIFGNAIVGVYRIAKSIYNIPAQVKLYCQTKSNILSGVGEKRVYYIGIPAHNNLGDLAQGVCIRRWLKKNYADRRVVEIETNALVNTRFSALKYLKKVFSDDVIVFQSGYTTTDLGGHADEMHCAIIKNFPQAKILMMPQTIFFQNEERKKNTSFVYNSAENMLFLARDRVSFGMAEEMFPDLPIRLYPDIVTTLIGQYKYENERNGILFCCRDDSEKYYDDEKIAELIKRCEKFAPYGCIFGSLFLVGTIKFMKHLSSSFLLWLILVLAIVMGYMGERFYSFIPFVFMFYGFVSQEGDSNSESSVY